MITLEATDIAQAHQYFAQTHARLLDATIGLSEAQWKFKSAEDRWSIAEILEHLVIVHERVMSRIQEQLPTAPAPPANFDSQTLDAVVIEKIPDRSIRAKAPDFIEPAGLLTPSQSLERIAASYQRLANYVESATDLRDHVLESPPLRVVTAGAHTVCDGYQWALTAAGHDERHVRQIEELKADPNYPAS